jgi:hypothetical protein
VGATQVIDTNGNVGAGAIGAVGNIFTYGEFSIGATTVIDSSRNAYFASCLVGGVPVAISNAVVSSLAASGYGALTGAVTLAAGANITITPSGSTLTISAAGGGGSYTAGTGVSIVSNVISIGQAVGTGNAVTFSSVATSAGMQINQSGGYGLYLPSSYVYANGFNSFNSSWNGIQSSSGGVSSYLGFYLSTGAQMINSSGQFCGYGVSCPSYGVQAAGFNPTGYTGQSYTLYFPSGFQVSGVTYYNVHFIGGVFVSLS